MLIYVLILIKEIFKLIVMVLGTQSALIAGFIITGITQVPGTLQSRIPHDLMVSVILLDMIQRDRHYTRVEVSS